MSIPISTRVLVAACLAASAALAPIAASAQDAATLRARHAALQDKFANNQFGRPLVLELLLAGCTTTACHRFTRDLEAEVRRADIVLVVVRHGQASRRNLDALRRLHRTWPDVDIRGVVVDTPPDGDSYSYYAGS